MRISRERERVEIRKDNERNGHVVDDNICYDSMELLPSHFESAADQLNAYGFVSDHAWTQYFNNIPRSIQTSTNMLEVLSAIPSAKEDLEEDLEDLYS